MLGSWRQAELRLTLVLSSGAQQIVVPPEPLISSIDVFGIVENGIEKDTASVKTGYAITYVRFFTPVAQFVPKIVLTPAAERCVWVRPRNGPSYSTMNKSSRNRLVPLPCRCDLLGHYSRLLTGVHDCVGSSPFVSVPLPLPYSFSSFSPH